MERITCTAIITEDGALQFEGDHSEQFLSHIYQNCKIEVQLAKLETKREILQKAGLLVAELSTHTPTSN